MMDDPAPLDVIHNREAHRFEVHLAGETAELVYELRDGVYVFTHAGVPRAFEGRGVGSALVRAGLDAVRADGAKMIALCAFVETYVRRHREYEDLRARR